MKTFLLYFLITLLAITVQATVFKGVKPDIVFLVVYFYAIRFGQLKGAAFGALSGLFMDAVSGFALGPNIISKTVAGVLSAFVREKFIGWNLLLNTIMVFSILIVENLIVYVCLEIFSAASFSDAILGPLSLQAFYTTAVAMVVYAIMMVKGRIEA
ncbi:MAG: rod shape-determining protein MreD [Nitrospirae bacterium]|nr:rod shape-determining protein MreD [Nitrospirota bacterium]